MGPNGQMFIVLGMYNFADHQNLPPFIFKGKIIQGSIRKDVDISLVKGPIVYCSSSFLISVREGYLDHNICLFNVKSISKEMKKEVKGTKCSKVASSNTSHLEAHADFFRLLMKVVFDAYVL